MTGTVLNVLTVAIGSALGLMIGGRLSEELRGSVVTGLGLITLTVGMQNAMETGNILIPLFSILIGVIVGEMIGLEAGLDRLGAWLHKRFAGGEPGSARERFITGFVTSSLVFCVGPLTVLGSIQDGMTGDYRYLAIKSVLDGFASMAFAASLGIGVAFSIVTVLLVQGSLSLAGHLAGSFMTQTMTVEMTATGGIILLGLAMVLLEIKKPRVANFLPALVIAPALVAALDALGIPAYPTLP